MLSAFFVSWVTILWSPDAQADGETRDSPWRTIPADKWDTTTIPRTGPGESYPAVTPLQPGEPFQLVLDDPGGWSAIQRQDGQTVWVPTLNLKEVAEVTSAPVDSKAPRKESLPVPLNGLDHLGDKQGSSVATPASFWSAEETRPNSREEEGWRPAGWARAALPQSSSGGPQPTSEGLGRDSHAVSASPLVIQANPVLPSQGSVSASELLDRLERQLIKMLTTDPMSWDLKSFEEALGYLAGQPLDPGHISHLKRLVERVTEAKQIAQAARSQQSVGVPPTGALNALPPASIVPTPAWTPLAPANASLTIIPPPATRSLVPANSPVLPLAFEFPNGAPSSDTTSLADYTSRAPEVSQASFVAQSLSNNKGGDNFPLLQKRAGEFQPPAENRPIPTRKEFARELNELRRQRFDAVGRLVRAQVRRPSDPPYLVMNERGEIEAYVRPAPGTVLRSYVGHHVGIVGRKVRSADGRGPLLVAESVQILDPPHSGEISLSKIQRKKD